MQEHEFVYVTVLTNQRYLPGVWVLSQSLKAVRSQYGLIVLIPENRKEELGEQLQKWQIEVITAPPLPAPNSLRNGKYADSHWNETFFKLRVAELLQFKKVIMLDSDMVILKNLDHLFEMPSYTAVAADRYSMSYSTHLNSGLMVIVPGHELSHRLQANIEPAVARCLASGRSAGDQDVFQETYPDWNERKELQLPVQYNLIQGVSGMLCRRKIPQGYKGVYVVHFIGRKKPWDFSAKDYVYMAYHGIKQRNFAELKAGLQYCKYLRQRTAYEEARKRV